MKPLRRHQQVYDIAVEVRSHADAARRTLLSPREQGHFDCVWKMANNICELCGMPGAEDLEIAAELWTLCKLCDFLREGFVPEGNVGADACITYFQRHPDRAKFAWENLVFEPEKVNAAHTQKV